MMKTRSYLLLLLLVLTTMVARAQINIHGNVFGGARQANVGGSTFVEIDAKHHDVVINAVYGGNDISGTIGKSSNNKMPDGFTPSVNTTETKYVDQSFDAFIHVNNSTKRIFIGKLFGGGYGKYDYISPKLEDNETDNPYYKMLAPVLGKTYLQIQGGTIGHVFGGGNSATVIANTTICIDNTSTVVKSIKDGGLETGAELLDDDRLEEMGLNTTQTDIEGDFQFARVFGGNNLVDMAIRPTWFLKKGKIRDLYSGGNEGRMTSPTGLLLEINADNPDAVPTDADVLHIDNVYGGCRKSDVRPLDANGVDVPNSQIALDPNPNNIPAGFAARVRVVGGYVNNVYGGNDISGKVYGGNTLGIMTTIHGNVYGGGNGSYAYTDNVALKDDPLWGDYYYNPGSNSVASLNDHRPNAEQVSIRVSGSKDPLTSVEKRTIIEGSLYVGGNSATLKELTEIHDRKVELKIGSYVTIDDVFLGNNGENMVDASENGILKKYAGNVTDSKGDVKDFSSLDLTNATTFAAYMDGCATALLPSVSFDDGYEPYSTRFGSFFCGGNVGSVNKPGTIPINFNQEVVIFNKLVGGCNNANVPFRDGLNAPYEGGYTGAPDATTNDKLILNISGLKIQPKRFNADKTALEWNVVSASTGLPVDPVTSGTVPVNSTDADIDRRLVGGNIYGGCYNTGHINGNVVINLNSSVVDRKGDNAIFDEVEVNEGEAILYGNDSYKITKRHTGVILDEQGMDVLGKALNVFGGGFGEDSEIWGSTTINLNAGYAFQVFGGGEKGAIGKGTRNETTHKLEYPTYDPAYSCYINLKGEYPGVYRGHTDDNPAMAEAEFVYGGGFFGTIAGNTQINLGNGRVFNSFAGSCNADILGHTETYVGRSGVDADGHDIAGFPWVRDHIYGGNDLGGRIHNEADFASRVSATASGKVYNNEMLKASAYIEYTQGRVDYIYGGCYGVYDYKDPHYKEYFYTTGSEGQTEVNLGTARPGYTKPRMDNAFVNFKPNTYTSNAVSRIFGAGQGYEHEKEMNMMQNRSYVLIDAPQSSGRFVDMDVFGAGSFGGLGMGVTKAEAADDLNKVSAVIDLVSGKIANVYGGSWNEGVTRRTMVRVPEGSTINANNLFGGAFGDNPLVPCDVYEAHVNYASADATLRGNIYGGNNKADRTLYGFVDINAPVWQDREAGYLASVYGAGYGKDSWSQYTQVNLNAGAQCAYVYGGGQDGKVLNLETVNKWKQEDPNLDLTLGADYNTEEGLNASLVKANGLGTKTNTNVNIYKGAMVGHVSYTDKGVKVIGAGYAFGGGYGGDAVVSGTTYVGLHGGTVGKDIYGGGYGGSVVDERGSKNFMAQTNAYIEGGTLRKVFGGGYEGHVGNHVKSGTDEEPVVAGSTANDILGATNVVIGIRQDQATLPEGGLTYYKGVPAIQWNAYGAGEGGSVFGTSHLTINNGYIGYDYDEATNTYKPKLDNETVAGSEGIGQLKDYGSAFGAGYDDKSSSDFTDIKMYGGVVRGSLYGGGEISAVGRGWAKKPTGTDRQVAAIYLAGGTHIEMYNGKVLRHVFGGGKGYNLYGYGGSNALYTDGYVFGKTEVYIHGGDVGSPEGLAEGYGNVFGGGDVGFVYGTGYLDAKTAAEKARDAKGTTGSPNHWYYYGSYKCNKDYLFHKVGDIISDVAYNALPTDERSNWTAGKYLTEDCKVIVEPWLQVKKGQTLGTYGEYAYVPTSYLNTLPRQKDANGIWTGGWEKLSTGDKLSNGNPNPEDPEERGIHIYNAVFAGGNVSSNSDQTYANAKTIFGNSTATLNDVYHRDFITVGTEHIGGLYGGGNLSVVDGYRELNITNYGTDYYAMNTQITLEEYQTLTNRERAYFQLEYLCTETHTYNGVDYTENVSRITEDDYNAITDATEKAMWQQYGFCSIYAGRLLNTIQRADFCGVFGSRLVLQGAKDRVADVGDNTVYTLNRIGELSLNKQHSIISSDTGDDLEHGNYFGIYSVVNYLGHLTSDVHFTDTYQEWDDINKMAVPKTGSYYDWKTNRLKYRDRNNGTCHNQVALASGVFLEVTTEFSTPSKKVYGDITGVVELDLINVKQDIEGGGYVYARNEHGAATYHSDYQNVILSSYNEKNEPAGRWEEANTYKRFTYSDSPLDLETSGNFIHKKKRIVDDCYPHNGVYNDGYVESPAHYWFIKGEVYVYDREVSAYAGSATAYMKDVNLPLTITAASEGKLQLVNVKPNLYAYYNDYQQTTRMDENGVKVNNESETYHLNDVITWWDWNQLPANEQKYFIQETFINVDSCTVGDKAYAAGEYVLAAQPVDGLAFNWKTVKDKKGNPVTEEADFRNLFRSSNNIGHDTGYVLTFDMDSPKDWDDRYIPNSGSGDIITKELYEALPAAQKADYLEGPTYQLTTNAPGLYGQREYQEGEILSKEVYDDYTRTVGTMSFDNQATVERAYVATVAYGNVQAGNGISEEAYNDLYLSPDIQAKYKPAMVCTNTIQLGDNEFILLGDLVEASDAKLTEIAENYKTYNNSKQNTDEITSEEALEFVKSHLSDAYICTAPGLYGGQYYETGKNYSAIKSWSSVSKDDRSKFGYNYDALDVLSDPTYRGEGHIEEAYTQHYSEEKPLEYTAVYTGTLPYTYLDKDGTSHEIPSGASIEQKTLTRDQFENIKNEQRNYTSITVPAGNDEYAVYIAKETFVDGGVPIAKGEDVTSKYKSLTAEGKAKVDQLMITKTATAQTVYYCYEGDNAGNTISSSQFQSLRNYQKGFVVQGKEPTGTITLYVSRESSAKDVLSEKVITLVYQYTYYEDEEEGGGTALQNELHVLNIHLNLESGVPEIGPLSIPPAVLPGNNVGLKTPSVNPGLYEPISNGWEMFTSEQDAEMQRNGEPFTNNGTKLYWYQNQKVWVAYYTKTVLGKTYSNPVVITVANYHDLSDVMADKENHMYIDHDGASSLRAPKIYLDQTKHSDENQLDLLKSLYDLSTGATVGDHTALNRDQVNNCRNLDFILRSDLAPSGAWTPIGTAEHCFEGTFHGDGHTISGLDHSLFDHLCGDVYNLGVTGSFTGAGIAETGSGYVENCWISTTSTETKSFNAVFGNPTGTDEKRPYRIVNSYYQEEDDAANKYTNPNSTYGTPTRANAQAFYNGTVAYNLNGSYLNKRYYDHAGLTSTNKYEYLKVDKTKTDNALTEALQIGYYPALVDGVSPSAPYGYAGYVEDRYDNEDFLYADGVVPDVTDVRQRTVMVEGNPNPVVRYAPIWPDDYLFFGQTLNYGYGTQTHDAHPSHLTKSSGRVSLGETSNRVYRAPAYYRSKTMGVAHFNPQAYLAAYSKPITVTDTDLKPAYPDMTAIDFHGYNDNLYTQGLNSGNGLFYQPLLDDDGLVGVANNGETQNLLVYAPTETDNQKTYSVLADYFDTPEPTCSISTEGYKTVAIANTGEIVGHLVLGNLTTDKDHLLVDKQDFNAPIAYTMGNGKRMWYQRTPDNFVRMASGVSMGWEDVSLPFTAELVTTQKKGEITHFYNGSTDGHEYWLREFKGNLQQKTVDGAAVTGVYTADFNYPAAGETDKTVANTFLWDYYYSKYSQRDINTDTYQKYYDSSRSFSGYPRLAKGTPYLIGFPSDYYYEFDLSGTFKPKYTYDAIDKLEKQTISFVSGERAAIGVSDDEMNGVEHNGVTFKPSYLNQKFAAPVAPATTNHYVLNSDGTSFDIVKADDNNSATTNDGPKSVSAFRPYFTGTVTAAARTRNVEQIEFSKSDGSFGIEDHDPTKGEVAGSLTIYAKKKKIVVESALGYTTDVRIVNTAGQTLSTFSIEPGETIETRINLSGVYIVQTADGFYTKKLVVR